MLAGSLENLLINGDFLPTLWGRVESPKEGVCCEVWRETFGADRWKVRYATAAGAPVTVASAAETPLHGSAPGSLELRGAPGVTQPVLVGQRIEAADAPRYRQRLAFSAWVWISDRSVSTCDLSLVFTTALEPDVFDAISAEDGPLPQVEPLESIPTGRWVHLEREIDGRAFASHGLSVEIEFPAAILNQEGARVRLAQVRLAESISISRSLYRPAAIEHLLARRFFQKHDGTSVNAIGRALVVNAHELHFQFTFPEMRANPACTFVGSESDLRTFNLEGIPQDGFRYDVTYRSRSSIIIRATKLNHGLRDGYLAFIGYGGAILLEAEL